MVDLEKNLRAEAAQAEEPARLQTMPGAGTIGAVAVAGFAPPMESLKRGRDFPAWLGLLPRQHATGERSGWGARSRWPTR